VPQWDLSIAFEKVALDDLFDTRPVQMLTAATSLRVIQWLNVQTLCASLKL